MAITTLDMEKIKVYTVKRKKENWVVSLRGAAKASKVAPTQAEAIKFARELARNQKAKLSIYKADGKLRETVSYQPASEKKKSAKSKSVASKRIGKPSKKKFSVGAEVKKLIGKTAFPPKDSATNAQIANAEKKIGFKFPAEYKSFLKAGGAGLDVRMDLFDVRDLPRNLKEARQWLDLPEDLLPIGDNNGDYFCLEPSGKVAVFLHDHKTIGRRWNSVGSFVKNYLSSNKILITKKG